MKKYFVYKHTAPNGKIYVGITSMTPEKRWNNGFGYSYNCYFWFDIVQFGWQNIKHEILYSGISKEEAEKAEIDLIKKYRCNTFDRGYNIENGGNCKGKCSKATIERRRFAMMGSKNQNSKSVLCVETGEVFESTGEASRAKSINQSHISHACIGKRKTAGKLHWKYI